MLEIHVKKFDELTIQELYGLLELRSAVFVVEQDCVYQDLDGKDKKALHIFGTIENEVIAYTRIFKPGDYFNESSIGRVAVNKNFRKFGYGKEIMVASIKAIEQRFNHKTITISAQTYLNTFYSDLGFKAIGDGYLEDGIPHVKMVKY